ncbi:putative replication factor c subunit [Neospora caninum Liverpool]|uniref:Putative replication factor c subunit n=1 Tax=Neospora caninum (strain Liverpool) TaxID=572307 RepID=F0VKE5_NEOCL|nr:putative replication factor c subunit [Neospora caninum Liverpool]CBZ54546.1 putative replication factor c subunit [Neospora caninum Liverpool]|eukprot:XP_003884576.1 putative replication factor c subunit [Neospora caninum Liverpool]
MDKKRGDIRAFFKPKAPLPSSSAKTEKRKSASAAADSALAQGGARLGGGKKEQKEENPAEWGGREEKGDTKAGSGRVAGEITKQSIQLSSDGESPTRISKASSAGHGRGKSGRLRRIASSDEEENFASRSSGSPCTAAAPPGSSPAKVVWPPTEAKRRSEGEPEKRAEENRRKRKEGRQKERAREVVDVDDFFSSSVEKAVEKALTRPPQKARHQVDLMHGEEASEEGEERAKERTEAEAVGVTTDAGAKRPVAHSASQWAKLVKSMEPEQVRQKKKREARESSTMISDSEDEKPAGPGKPTNQDDDEYVQSSEEDDTEDEEEDEDGESEEEDGSKSMRPGGRTKAQKDVRKQAKAVAKSPTVSSPSSPAKNRKVEERKQDVTATMQPPSTGKRMYPSKSEEKTEQTSPFSPSAHRKKRKIEDSVPSTKQENEDRTAPLAGSKSSFAGKTFVFTGVLDSMGRDEAVAAVVGNGGRCTSAVSGKTDYLVAGSLLEDGRDVTTGSKYRKALQLMQDGSAKQKASLKILHEQEFLAMLPESTQKKPKMEARKSPEEASRIESEKAVKCDQKADGKAGQQSDETSQNVLWAEKYRPKRADDFVGNREHLRTLQAWLADWADVCLHGKKKKPPPRSFAPSFSPYGFAPTINLNARAALLSGPPGIGKTTAARLAAEAAGYDVLEYNASDARNKAHIEDIGNMTSGGLTLHSFLDQKNEASHGTPEEIQTAAFAFLFPGRNSKRPMGACVLMDEVDGLSGGDRGGAQAIVKLIETSKCPIICICNDRMHPKVRTIASKCLDLRFHPPHMAALRSRVEDIATAEDLALEPQAIGYLCESAGGDLRQILNSLQMLAYETRESQKDGSGKSREENTDFSTGLKDDQVMHGPFECCKQLLDAHQASKLSRRQKLDKFFSDYDLIPLLIQNQQWGMLPDIGFLCCVSLPAKVEKAQGFLGRVQFPSWLGRNSTQTKHKRLLTELLLVLLNQLQCCSTSSGLKLSGYLDALYRKCVGPLVRLSKADPKMAVEAAMQAMAEYSFTRGMVVDNLNSLRLKNQERQDGEGDMDATAAEDNVDAPEEDDDDPLRDSFILSAVKGKKGMKGASGRNRKGGGSTSTPREESNAARRGRKGRAKGTA